MIHWLAEQMPKGQGPWDVGTLVAPDGTVWSVGDDVVMQPFTNGPYHNEPPAEPTKIEVIVPGDGDWRAVIPGGDCSAVWFGLSNGWWSRPWLLQKVKR